jgi:hypothetical protein|tara:strand:+ start:2927 stop:3700 length:774 start_codon:yes stop_codon:yes gene_type:complete
MKNNISEYKRYKPRSYKGVVYYYYSLTLERYFYDYEYTNCYNRDLGSIAVRIIKDGEEYMEGFFNAYHSNRLEEDFKFKEIGYSNSYWVQYADQNNVPKTVDGLRIDFPCVGKGALKKTPIRQREDAFNRGARFDVFIGDKMDTDVGAKFRGLHKKHEGLCSWRPQRIKIVDYHNLRRKYEELQKFRSGMFDDTLSYPNNMRYLNLDDGTSMTKSEYETIRKMVDSDYRTNDEILNSTNDDDYHDLRRTLVEIDDDV